MFNDSNGINQHIPAFLSPSKFVEIHRKNGIIGAVLFCCNVWRLVMSKLYMFNLDTSKKTFYVRASGSFEEVDAKVYISEFQTIVNTINPSVHTLIVDASEQEAVPKQVLNDVRFVLRLYESARFKKIVIINPTSIVSRMQIDYCAKEINFSGVFVNSLKEAIPS